MRIEHVSVATGYDRWAKDYDDYTNPLIAVEEAPVRAMLDAIGVSKKRVLDAGCGTARHAGFLHARGARVVGLDESAAMLDVARKKYPAIDLRLGSILESAKAGIEDATFDVVLNALSAEHFADLGALLAALARPLAPGGALVLSVWHPFMALKGVPTHYEDDAAGVEYVLPTHVHLPSAYFRGLRDLGFDVSEMLEPVCDDALVAKMPHMKKHAGLPIALVVRATRRV
jgi:SAM-dependent methyltransferase